MQSSAANWRLIAPIDTLICRQLAATAGSFATWLLFRCLTFYYFITCLPFCFSPLIKYSLARCGFLLIELFYALVCVCFCSVLFLLSLLSWLSQRISAAVAVFAADIFFWKADKRCCFSLSCITLDDRLPPSILPSLCLRVFSGVNYTLLLNWLLVVEDSVKDGRQRRKEKAFLFLCF